MEEFYGTVCIFSYRFLNATFSAALSSCRFNKLRLNLACLIYNMFKMGTHA